MKSYKYFIGFFSLFLIVYGFNSIDIIKSAKITQFLVLPILFFYLVRNSYILTREIKVGFLIIAIFFISMFDTIVNYNSQLLNVFDTNVKILIIFLMIVMFYNFYHKQIHIQYFDKFIPLIIFIFVISNIMYYVFFYKYTDRFEGTFGGSNEFAFFIVLYIYLSYYHIFKYYNIIKNSVLKGIIIFNVIGLHLLVLITLSRTAIIGLVIFYIIAFPYFNNQIKLGKKILYLVIVIFVLVGSFDYINKSISLLEKRFIDNEGKHSLDSRFYEADAAINLLSNHIDAIVIGIGTSFTSNEQFYKIFYTNKHIKPHRIHNSYLALITENGILALLLFLYLLFITIENILKIKSNFKYVMLGYVIFIILFMMLIYLIYFFPLWFAIYILNLHAMNLNREKVVLFEKEEIVNASKSKKSIL